MSSICKPQLQKLQSNNDFSNNGLSTATSTNGSFGTASSPSCPSVSTTSRAVWTGRILFLFTLLIVAATFGSLSYYLLTKSEHTLTIQQFASIAERATCSAMDATERKRLGTQSLASVIAGANPNADQWPNVVLNNYETIATNLIHTSKGCNMVFAPFVPLDRLEDFEDFIYDFYEHSRQPEPFANGTAAQPFGKGVWEKDEEGNVVHSSGTASDFVAPMIHHNTGASKNLLFNLNSNPMRAQMIQDMKACAEHKALTNGSLDDCVVVSPMAANKTSKVQRVESGPGASLMQPVAPANDPTKLVGVVVTGIVWTEIMVATYANTVTGVDVVLTESTSGEQYTYEVIDGQAYLRGEGDLHDAQFDAFAHTLDMTSPEFFGPTSSHYTLTLYPTQELYNVYKTPNPTMAAIGAVGVIALTSILFLLYDLSVRREFHAKQELLEAKRRFCRFVSHEVRTPLNSVTMGLTLMTEEMKAVLKKTTSEDTSDSSTNQSNCASWLTLTEEITANANSAVNVLNEFLNYDKVQSGKLTLEHTIVPIFDLVERTASEFKVPMAKKNIKLIVETPLVKDLEGGCNTTQEKFLVGDKVRLTMVVRNLISNALKFTPSNGTVNIRASWVPPSPKELKKKAAPLKFCLENQSEPLTCTSNGSFQLTVSDTGVGMTPDQIKTVFRQGSQFNVNQLQAGKGSGLGTWIAKGIIRQHGGLLSAASDGLNKGSTFTVNLPIHQVPSCLEPVKASVTSVHKSIDFTERDEEEEEEEDPMGSLNILVVDDAKMNLKLLSRLLEKHGHVVTQADDGDIAVDKVKEAQKPFDVVLMDYQMPRMCGPDAAREIRSMGSDAFIVGVTGNVMPEDVRVFKDAGANAVLPKPIKIPDLESLWVEYGIRGDDDDWQETRGDQSMEMQVTLAQS